MEQKREPRNRAQCLWSIHLCHRRQGYMTGKRSVQGRVPPPSLIIGRIWAFLFQLAFPLPLEHYVWANWEESLGAPSFDTTRRSEPCMLGTTCENSLWPHLFSMVKSQPPSIPCSQKSLHNWLRPLFCSFQSPWFWK